MTEDPERGGRHLPIGALSRRTRCSVDTIRFYERIGLMAPPARSDGGHRRYGAAQVRRLNFIRRGRELGFSLAEMRRLLGQVERQAYGCAGVRPMLAGRAAVVRRTIARLQALERNLNGMIAACGDATAPDCSVIDALLDDGALDLRRFQTVCSGGRSGVRAKPAVGAPCSRREQRWA